MSHRRAFLRRFAGLAGAVAVGAALGSPAHAADAPAKTIKVGVLHSLSGTMAISETVLKDTALMAFEEINAKGGVMGYRIEPVVVDSRLIRQRTGCSTLGNTLPEYLLVLHYIGEEPPRWRLTLPRTRGRRSCAA